MFLYCRGVHWCCAIPLGIVALKLAISANTDNYDWDNTLQVPNVSMPNGDGVNEIFKVFVEGEMVPEGTYMYIIGINGNVAAGTLTLLRN